jgi:hypothetical protein
MKRVLLAALLAAAAALVQPARAEVQVLEYRVEHPLYGDIGTYTTVVERHGDAVEVRSDLHIAVKLLGVVVHRQDGTSVERWDAGRLVAFHSRTDANGEVTAVAAEVRGEEFVIDSSLGRFTAPLDVRPSNPWSPEILGASIIMSTRTGKLFKVRLGRTADRVVVVDGKPTPLREYEVVGEKRQALWLDESGAPIAFRTEENGTTIAFVLAPYASSSLRRSLWPAPASDSFDVANSSR